MNRTAVTIGFGLLLVACSGSTTPGDGGDGTSNDASVVCHTASDCASGQDCIYATAACGGTGVCMMHQECGRASQQYCGCDGRTFFDTCEGPGAPWVSMGACGADGGMDVPAADVPTADVPASDGPRSDATVDSGGGACDGGACPGGLTCCNGGCMNLQNDPLNCGACGHGCNGATSMCSGGSCVAPTCSPACGAGQICCNVPGPGPVGAPVCESGPTCPVGCPLCR